MKPSALTFSHEDLEALSRLAAPWAAAELSEQVVRIRLDDASVVTLTSEGIDGAPFFECFRLAIATSNTAVVGQPPAPFKPGARSIHILQSEQWFVSERSPDGNLMGNQVGSHHSGVPGTAPRKAEHSCLVDAGVLLVAPTGERFLIRCAAMPCWLKILTDDEAIEAGLQNYSVRDLMCG